MCVCVCVCVGGGGKRTPVCKQCGHESREAAGVSNALTSVAICILLVDRKVGSNIQQQVENGAGILPGMLGQNM